MVSVLGGLYPSHFTRTMLTLFLKAATISPAHHMRVKSCSVKTTTRFLVFLRMVSKIKSKSSSWSESKKTLLLLCLETKSFSNRQRLPALPLWWQRKIPKSLEGRKWRHTEYTIAKRPATKGLKTVMANSQPMSSIDFSESAMVNGATPSKTIWSKVVMTRSV